MTKAGKYKGLDADLNAITVLNLHQNTLYHQLIWLNIITELS